MFTVVKNPSKFIPLAKSNTKRGQNLEEIKKTVKFIDEAISESKDDIKFMPQDFMKYIDKFISNQKHIVCIPLDGEYEAFLQE